MAAAQVAVPVRSLTLKLVEPKEIPRHLMEQKESIDVDEFYRLAERLPPGSGAAAFVLEDDGEPVSFLLFENSTLYHGLVTDTIVIDKKRRSPSFARKVFRIMYQAFEFYGRAVKARYIAVPTRNPKALLSMIGEGEDRIYEWILRKDLED